MTPLWNNRPLRRLFVAVLVLASVDPLIPPLVARLERNRYESDRLFRFENSDFFSLGPLTAYLREHRHGPRPRVVFLGDSVIWGYDLRPSQTLPAQFQRINPSVRVLNFGINGMSTPTAYLIARAVVDSVDRFYVLDVGATVARQLPMMIPVDAGDVMRFGLEPPDIEPRLENALGFWKLYAYGYRLQSAMFGMSTRQYLYLHKSEAITRLRGRPLPDTTPAAIPGGAEASRRIAVADGRATWFPSPNRMQQIRKEYPVLWDLATTVREHGKQAVLIALEGHSNSLDDAREDLNAYFHPDVRFVKIGVPPDLKLDGAHLSPLGAAAVAQVLTLLASGEPAP